MNLFPDQFSRWLPLGVMVWLLFARPGGAATSMVNIDDDVFIPRNTTIAVNDTVQWRWIGSNPHSTTSTTGLWDSGVLFDGSTFSRQFTSGGNFPYFCTVHPLQTGSINVQAANALPSVELNWPTNGTIFSAPLTNTLKAAATDSDGTVQHVQFFNGTMLLGQDSAQPFELTVENLPAGEYTLIARAIDDRGGSNSTAGITVSVVTPVEIILSNPQRISPTEFRFTYTANVGLRYAVERTMSLANWNEVITGTAAGDSITVTDEETPEMFHFYRVRLLPNPEASP